MSQHNAQCSPSSECFQTFHIKRRSLSSVINRSPSQDYSAHVRDSRDADGRVSLLPTGAGFVSLFRHPLGSQPVIVYRSRHDYANPQKKSWQQPSPAVNREIHCTPACRHEPFQEELTAHQRNSDNCKNILETSSRLKKCCLSDALLFPE